MKKIGFALIAVGFLAGAYFSVVENARIPLGGYLAALGAGVLGIFLIRWSARQAAGQVERLNSDMSGLEERLERIVERSNLLVAQDDPAEIYTLRRRIDLELREDLDAFAAARESIAQRHGLSAYAEVMNRFAAGERYLNRVWSASTDGYADEASTYLGKAQEQFQETLSSFRQLRA